MAEWAYIRLQTPGRYMRQSARALASFIRFEVSSPQQSRSHMDASCSYGEILRLEHIHLAVVDVIMAQRLQ